MNETVGQLHQFPDSCVLRIDQAALPYFVPAVLSPTGPLRTLANFNLEIVIGGQRDRVIEALRVRRTLLHLSKSSFEIGVFAPLFAHYVKSILAYSAASLAPPLRFGLFAFASTGARNLPV